MTIDSHQHFWKFDPIRDSWIDETMGIIRKDFFPKDLKPILNANAIDGCIAVQADQSEEETMFLLNCAEENDFIKGVVGWVDLLADSVEDRLAHFSQNERLKGVRHIVQAEANDFMLEKKFQNGISRLKQFDLTYDILVFPPQLEAAIMLANTFSDQQFILDHIAKPYIKDGKIDIWKRHIFELARCSNVSCKVSGMVTEADFKLWKTSDFSPYLDVVFEAFGVDRIMYGSDWPVCLLAAEYEQQLGIVQNYVKDFSEEDQAKIYGKNAIRDYNL